MKTKLPEEQSNQPIGYTSVPFTKWNPLNSPTFPEPNPVAQPNQTGEMSNERCPQCGNGRDDPREDSIERMLICGDSFHQAKPSASPTEPFFSGDPVPNEGSETYSDFIESKPSGSFTLAYSPESPKDAWEGGYVAGRGDGETTEHRGHTYVIPRYVTPAAPTESEPVADGGELPSLDFTAESVLNYLSGIESLACSRYQHTGEHKYLSEALDARIEEPEREVRENRDAFKAAATNDHKIMRDMRERMQQAVKILEDAWEGTGLYPAHIREAISLLKPEETEIV